MKLYLLERIRGIPGLSDRDVMVRVLVRAPDARTSRRIANDHALDEGLIWTDASLASVREIKAGGNPGVIIADVI